MQLGDTVLHISLATPRHLCERERQRGSSRLSGDGAQVRQLVRTQYASNEERGEGEGVRGARACRGEGVRGAVPKLTDYQSIIDKPTLLSINY
jgi:hypothetical protein